MRCSGCTIDGCPLAAGGARARAPQRRRLRGAAARARRARCRRTPRIAYALLRDVDPTHRGIAKIAAAGQRRCCRCSSRPLRRSRRRPRRRRARRRRRTRQRRDARRRPTAPAGVSARRRAPHPDRLRPRAVPALPAAAVGDAPHAARLAAGRASRRRRCGRWSASSPASRSRTRSRSGWRRSKLVSLPPAFIEPAIAVTIVARRARQRASRCFRCGASSSTFFFGLVHGFGFAGVLAELDLPPRDFAWALLQFNLGIEVGQLVIVALATTLLFALRRWRALSARRRSAAARGRDRRRRAVAHRAHANVSIAAASVAAARLTMAASALDKSEKGMMVMTPRTTHPGPEGRRPPRVARPQRLSRLERKARPAPRFFLCKEPSHDLDSIARRLAPRVPGPVTVAEVAATSTRSRRASSSS